MTEGMVWVVDDDRSIRFVLRKALERAGIPSRAFERAFGHGVAQFGKPEEIIGKPENGFVKKFILNQLEIKKNNIYALFSGQLEEQAQVC